MSNIQTEIKAAAAAADKKLLCHSQHFGALLLLSKLFRGWIFHVWMNIYVYYREILFIYTGHTGRKVGLFQFPSMLMIRTLLCTFFCGGTNHSFSIHQPTPHSFRQSLYNHIYPLNVLDVKSNIRNSLEKKKFWRWWCPSHSFSNSVRWMCGGLIYIQDMSSRLRKLLSSIRFSFWGKKKVMSPHQHFWSIFVRPYYSIS